jgi:high affinity Mn2+ porin
MPSVPNSFTVEDQFLTWPNRGGDDPFFTSWGMAGEYERRYSVNTHPGTIRLMSWLNEADMVSYSAAIPLLLAGGPGANLSAAAAYRYKYGFGMSWDQEVLKDVGIFSRLGWNDGHN